MNFHQLLTMDSRFVSYGLHKYRHESLITRQSSEIITNITKCMNKLSMNGIAYLPVLAYPHGAYPKDKVHKKAFMDWPSSCASYFLTRAAHTYHGITNCLTWGSGIGNHKDTINKYSTSK